jgi:hypothetical protein
MAFALWLLGSVEEWLSVSRAGGHNELLAWALGTRAAEAERQGELDRPRVLREESLLLHRQLGIKLPIAWWLLEEAGRAFGHG